MRHHGMFFLALTLGVTSYSDEFSLDLTVTATQSPESLQDVPIPVTAISDISDEKLQRFGDQELEGLRSNINSPTIHDRPILREVGVFELTGRIMCKIIQINYIDPYGGPIRDPIGDIISSTLDVSPRSYYRDLVRIEVIRGPRGTLYGESSTGDVVNVDTSVPIDVRMVCYPIDDMDATRQPSMIDIEF